MGKTLRTIPEKLANRTNSKKVPDFPFLRENQELFYGGEGEIRTLDTLLGYTRFPIVRARPATRLLHRSALCPARL